MLRFKCAIAVASIVILSATIWVVRPAFSRRFFRVVEEYPPYYFKIDILNGDLSHPVVNEKTVLMSVYIEEDNYLLYGIDSENGQVHFKTLVNSAKYCTDGEAIYSAEKGGIVRAIDPSTETVLWDTDLGEIILHGPMLEGSKLYLVTLSSSLFALDAQTGAQIYRISKNKFKGSLEAPPAVRNGIVYIATTDGMVYRLVEGRIEVMYEVDTYIDKPPLLVGDRMFVASSDGFFDVGMDSSGEVRKYTSNVGSIRQMAIAAGKYLVIAGRNKVECFDVEAPSRLLWEWPKPHQAVQTVQTITSDGETVYIATEDIWAVDIHTGSNGWQYNENAKALYDEEWQRIYIDNNAKPLTREQEAELRERFPRIKGNIVDLQESEQTKAILVGTDEGHLYSIGSDGQLKWHFQASLETNQDFALARSSLLLGAGDFGMYEIDPLNMGNSRCFVTEDTVLTRPAVDGDGDSLYVICSSGALYKFSLRTRQIVWKHRVIGGGDFPPILNESRDKLFVTSTGGCINALSAIDHTSLGEFRTSGAISCHPFLYEGRLYVGSEPQKLYVLSEECQEIAQFDIDGSIRSTPGASDGIVYFGTDKGVLYKLDAARADKPVEIWNIRCPINSSPSVADGKIYFGCDDGLIFALSLATGDEIWRFQTGGSIRSGITLDSEAAYFTSTDGCLYAINRNVGSLLWKYPIHGWPVFKPKIRGGIIYVVSPVGTLYGFRIADTL